MITVQGSETQEVLQLQTRSVWNACFGTTGHYVWYLNAGVQRIFSGLSVFHFRLLHENTVRQKLPTLLRPVTMIKKVFSFKERWSCPAFQQWLLNHVSFRNEEWPCEFLKHLEGIQSHGRGTPSWPVDWVIPEWLARAGDRILWGIAPLTKLLTLVVKQN